MLRPQARAETSAHKRPENPDIIGVLFKHAAEIALNVLHTLGLVVDGQLAVSLPYRGRSVKFHRVVVLGRDDICGFVPDGGSIKSLACVAARLFLLLDLEGIGLLRLKIRNVLLFCVVDRYERGCETRRIPILCENQRQRLPVETDLVIVEHTVGRTLFRSDVVFPRLVVIRKRRPVLMRKYFEHAGHLQCCAGVDAGDASLGDGRVDHEAEREIGRAELRRVLGGARDLRRAVDTGCRCAQYKGS